VECISRVFAIPPLATMENLTGQEMLDLADLYEGWAQDRRNDGLQVARLPGWADGFILFGSPRAYFMRST
jgi:hypothetical protein